VRKERRKTRKESNDFAVGLGERGTRERMDILRLESVLGIDRIRSSVPPTRGQGDKARLRELLLPSKRRERERNGTRSGNRDIPLAKVEKVDKGVDGDRHRESHWFNPPPPPHDPQNPILVDPSLITSGDPYMVGPTTPVDFSRSLLPPPRPRMRERENTSEKSIVRAGSAGKEKEEDGLDVRELWPDLPISPVFGVGEPEQGQGRADHAWI
jgi:hypothetical protein